VSTEQRETVDAILRQSAFPADSDVDDLRRLFREAVSAQPLPAGVTVTEAAGLALPAAAYLMSPYVDLTLAGTTMDTKRDLDPLLNRELLEPRVADYTAGQDAALALISPVFADLSGLPPLIIQAGSHEVLLDDAVRLAQQAAIADVDVTLEITPRVPHVFQGYSAMLDEGAAALDRAGQLLSAHLAGAERVTA
jgi:monoterpene epsilon-lactone hydrolase